MHKHLPKYTRALISRSRNLRRDMKDAERKLWSLLRNNRFGLKFRRQVPYGDCVLDFLCVKAKLVVEADGGQHCTQEGLRGDQRRTGDLRKDGLEVLRFSNIEILTNSDGVEQAIYEKVQCALKTKA
jgi:very-short-patch-repair endonuclease